MTDRNEGRDRLGRDSSPRERRTDADPRASERSSDDTYSTSGTPGTSGDTRSDGYTDSTRSTDSGDRGDQNKGSIDKLIDKAQEKGIFDKAEKLFRDKFGGGSGGSKRR